MNKKLKDYIKESDENDEESGDGEGTDENDEESGEGTDEESGEGTDENEEDSGEDNSEESEEEEELPSIVAAFAAGDTETARELIKQHAMQTVVDAVRSM